MKRSAFAKNLTILSLGLLLSLSPLLTADHLHHSSGEEVDCEVCIHAGPAAAGESAARVPPRVEKRASGDEPSRIPPERRRLHQHQRGPPVLLR